jgi:hypothetical protein
MALKSTAIIARLEAMGKRLADLKSERARALDDAAESEIGTGGSDTKVLRRLGTEIQDVEDLISRLEGKREEALAAEKVAAHESGIVDLRKLYAATTAKAKALYTTILGALDSYFKAVDELQTLGVKVGDSVRRLGGDGSIDPLASDIKPRAFNRVTEEIREVVTGAAKRKLFEMDDPELVENAISLIERALNPQPVLQHAPPPDEQGPEILNITPCSIADQNEDPIRETLHDGSFREIYYDPFGNMHTRIVPADAKPFAGLDWLSPKAIAAAIAATTHAGLMREKLYDGTYRERYCDPYGNSQSRIVPADAEPFAGLPWLKLPSKN